MVLYFEPLVAGAVGAASNMVHSKQQMVLLDQTKTVAECALQLVYATKEGGGNPKVSYLVAFIFASVVLNASYESNSTDHETFVHYNTKYAIAQ
jgi:talin